MSRIFRHIENFFLHTVCGVHIWVSTARSQRWCGHDDGGRGSRSDGHLQSRQEHDVVLASLPLFLDNDELLHVVVLCQLFCRFSFVVLDIHICTFTNEHRYYRWMIIYRCPHESGPSILSYKKKINTYTFTIILSYWSYTSIFIFFSHGLPIYTILLSFYGLINYLPTIGPSYYYMYLLSSTYVRYHLFKWSYWLRTYNSINIIQKSTITHIVSMYFLF